jgi:FkbM family methyltransferase
MVDVRRPGRRAVAASPTPTPAPPLASSSTFSRRVALVAVAAASAIAVAFLLRCSCNAEMKGILRGSTTTEEAPHSHCVRKDLGLNGVAPAAARADVAAGQTPFKPESWIESGLWVGDARVPFALALPSTDVSFVARFMATGDGVWAPVESMIFLSVLTSPKVRHAAPTVVDVGANLGYFSFLALALGYDVVAAEPQPRVQPYLAASAHRFFGSGAGAARSTDALALYACAIGAVRGHAQMKDAAMWEIDALRDVVPEETSTARSGGPEPSPPGTQTTHTVPLALLADLIEPLRPIALLKIDVEGFERGVLAGATPALLALVRNVIVEAKTAETRAYAMRILGEAGFLCRQYQELYVRTEAGEDYGKGGTLALRGKSRDALNSELAVHLVPCTVNDPEDYWFSRDDFPWSQCDVVGC